ncbi:TPR end-of-group domain-containing protein [Duganella sp. P38]|uniref:TPR end-of-group domain-containing protein n=1 Tax=Duganella sp. P38 TaxID=3423949 RepID=UPI003D797F28
MRRLSASILLVWATCAPLSHAALPAGADTVAHARDLRQQAAATADVERATALLEEALRSLKAAEQATANPALRQESYNTLLPLAALYGRQGRKEQALDALDQARTVIWLPAAAQMLRNDSAFDALRNEPRFQAMLTASEAPHRLWKGPASDHPYKEALTVEERIAGLTQFWAEARHSFVYFDKVPELDWNQVYMDYLPKVMAAQTTRDYYAVLRELAPLLKDGHTNIWAPGELNAEFEAVPPLRTTLVEGRVLVAHVGDAALRDRVRVGDEVLAVDGMAVHDYARQRVMPLVSAGAPQDRDFQTYTVGLLRGAAKAPAVLRLRAANGKERDESFGPQRRLPLAGGAGVQDAGQRCGLHPHRAFYRR